MWRHRHRPLPSRSSNLNSQSSASQNPIRRLDRARWPPATPSLQSPPVVNQDGSRTMPSAAARGTDRTSVPFRCVWPAELDRRLSWRLRLRVSWAGWSREPFTSESRSHASVWEKPAWPRRTLAPDHIGERPHDAHIAIVAAPPSRRGVGDEGGFERSFRRTCRGHRMDRAARRGVQRRGTIAGRSTRHRRPPPPRSFRRPRRRHRPRPLRRPRPPSRRRPRAPRRRPSLARVPARAPAPGRRVRRTSSARRASRPDRGSRSSGPGPTSPPTT